MEPDPNHNGEETKPNGRQTDKALNKACPLSPACTINKNNPWFTPQLKQLRIEVGAAFDKRRAHNTEHNAEVYRDRLKRYKRLITKTKTAITQNMLTPSRTRKK